jgi:hypothetical protein
VAYSTITEVKLDLGIAETTDDALLTSMLDGVIAAVNLRFPSKFEAETLTRYYDPTNERHVHGRTLILGKPLLTVTTLTNGDSAVITSGYYVKWPVNGPPYTRIILTASGGKAWTYSTDPEAAISIVGTWGYATTCPAYINLAVREWTAYLYRQKDSQVFDVTADLNTGQLIIPKGIPATVEKLLSMVGRSPL